MEFDIETLSPTYRLSIGLPGRSNALAIATRLGMKDDIVQGARELITPRRGGNRGPPLPAPGRPGGGQGRSGRGGAVAPTGPEPRGRLNAELEAMEERKHEVLQRAHEQSEQELASLRGRVQAVMRELDRAKLQQQAASEATQIADAASQRAEALRPIKAPRPRPQRQERVAAQELRVGQPVFVASLQKVGTVSTLPDDRGEVEVQVGMFRTRVKARELSRTDGAVTQPDREPEVTYRLDMDRAAAVSIQLDLRGKRVDEAKEELDVYLNDAYLAGLKLVRIIHGRGTGAVRQIVRDHLAASPLVRHFEAAGDREGGEGVTIASLSN